MTLWLGRWIPNLGVPGSKPLVGSKVDLVFHSSKIDQVSIFIYLFIYCRGHVTSRGPTQIASYDQ